MKTENWKLKTEKYCSKIIFKCVNSTVGPIFNKKNCWKVRFVGPVTEKLLKSWLKGTGKVAEVCTVHTFLVNNHSTEKKKIKRVKCVLRPDVDAKCNTQTEA